MVRSAVALVCEVDPTGLRDTTELVSELAADSVSLVEIADVIEAELRSRPQLESFHYEDAELAELTTVGDFIRVAQAHLAAR